MSDVKNKENSMHGFFYPENGERFLASVEFETADEAIAYWRDKRGTWDAIAATGPQDEAAFLNPRNGDIVVIRKLPAQGKATP